MARLARNLKKKPALQKKSSVQTSKTDRASRAEWRDLARQLQEERAQKTELQSRVHQLEAALASFTQGDGGTVGNSGAMLVDNGVATNGNSGSLTLATGDAASGDAGSMTVTVGSTNIATGGGVIAHASGSASTGAGTSFGITYQNQWNQVGCSQTVAFPSPESCTCRSGEDVNGNAMPGIFARDPFEETGSFSQSILIRGSDGLTMIGFVSTNDEKQNLLMKACDDWTKIPLMATVGFGGDYQTFTINVDMVNRTAELYSGSWARAQGETTTGAFPELQPMRTWENLPKQLWLGVAFKRRRTEREAVLLPGTHWKVSRMGRTKVRPIGSLHGLYCSSRIIR